MPASQSGLDMVALGQSSEMQAEHFVELSATDMELLQQPRPALADVLASGLVLLKVSKETLKKQERMARLLEQLESATVSVFTFYRGKCLVHFQREGVRGIIVIDQISAPTYSRCQTFPVVVKQRGVKCRDRISEAEHIRKQFTRAGRTAARGPARAGGRGMEETGPKKAVDRARIVGGTSESRKNVEGGTCAKTRTPGQRPRTPG